MYKNVLNLIVTNLQQECIPVGCVTSTYYHTGGRGLCHGDPLDRDQPGQNPPWTETPPDRDQPGQRLPSGQRDPPCEQNDTQV